MSLPLLRSLCLCLAVSTVSLLQAQDLHYSLLEFMPTWVNPGLTGAYEGTARIGGVYRDQQVRSLSENTYQTPGFYVDAPIVMLGKKAWLGVGGTLIADKAGFADLTSTYAQASASYHRILNKGRNTRTVFSFGVKGGVLNRSADFSSDRIKLEEETETTFGGGGFPLLGGLDRMGDPSSTGIDIGAGASLARQLDAERNFRVGISARHILQPDYALNQGGGKQTRPTSISLQGAYRQLLDDKYLIEPTIFLQTTETASAAQLQGMFGMYMGEESDKLIKFGLGVRLPARFVYPMVGFDYKDFKVAASFDLNANGLQAADGLQSGFEIGVQYIIKIYKEPKVDRVILCPQI
ncbi:MAG: PorP/SprF family type IX secretion system membrane protein [Saprospiraceae bacterium]